MQSTLTLPLGLVPERPALLSDHIRIRALERLYARRAAVDALIQSLEDYAEIRRLNRAACIRFTAARKCS